MIPCKHLDYDEDKYRGAAELVQIGGFKIPVSVWERLPPWSDTRERVQFCKLRGRIRGVFQCYNVGELQCHEPGREVVNE